MLNLVHVTHEAVQKIGGIGSVLEGLITSDAYDAVVDRSILLCPLFTTDGDVDSRLGPDGEVQYSSLDGRTDHPLAGAFREIQQTFHVELIYGHRALHNPLTGVVQRPEVVLIGVDHAAQGPMNDFKYRLYAAFGIDSQRYENSWDYEQYVRLAMPGLAAVKALGAVTGHCRCVFVAHEYMGMPTALAAKLDGSPAFATIFYAHEVSTARRIVEHHPGHDTSFYNVLRLGLKNRQYVTDIFGDQSDYARHALVSRVGELDVTFAVGDDVVRELAFLSPEMGDADIRLTYNGIPAHEITIEESTASRRRLQDYIETLLGFRPDHVFTHVTRLIASKGLWRDLNVMAEMDRRLWIQNKTAVLIVLSAEIGGPRRRDDIRHMERSWDWPVAHREGMPDLSEGEAAFYAGVQAFNARARNCKIIFINQFGFDRTTCGDRMPEDMAFWDIRKGSDLEFGQSIYEPFGIAQLEALSFGALCVMSSVCGCAHFVRRAAGGETPNVIAADYTAYRPEFDTVEAFLALTDEARQNWERRVAADLAEAIIGRLPRTPQDKATFLKRGYELASKMSWDVIVRNYFMPAIRDICAPTVDSGAPDLARRATATP